MKSIYYHGTSADNLPYILEHGLSCNENKLWTVSEDAVYLWEPKGCGEANGLDEEDYEQEGFKMANESAQIACAVAKDCRAVVLKIGLDDSEVSPDLSCENMEGRGAVVIYRDILPSEIIEISVSDDLSMIKGYFISILINNEYSGVEFTRIEETIAKCFEGNYDIIDYIDEIVTYKQLEITT